MTAHPQGIARRRAIMVFVYRYQKANGYGPRTAEIIRAVDYHGHSIRGAYLDKLPALEQAPDGRWRIVA